MLNRMKCLLCFSLCLSMLTCPVFAPNDDSPVDLSFTLSQIPEDITLVEALKEYPQIQEIYPIRIISAEEATVIIAQGADIRTDINAEELLAVPFLAQFNAAKGPP